VTVLWNRGAHTVREVTANKPDIIIKNKKANTCILIDVAILADRNVLLLLLLLFLFFYTLTYSISTLRSFTSALSDNFLYVAYTTEFPLSGPAAWIIWTTPPPYSPDYQGTTILNLSAKKDFFMLMETYFLQFLSRILPKNFRYYGINPSVDIVLAICLVKRISGKI
jgi:hypothetical protein